MGIGGDSLVTVAFPLRNWKKKVEARGLGGACNAQI